MLDLGGLQTVAGYNVYRNGEKRNTETLTRRYFSETEEKEGSYNYTVETVYINGETSSQSVSAQAIIFPTGEAKQPVNVAAKQSTYGYNVLLTFADPDMHINASKVDNFDDMTVGNEAYAVSHESYKSNWKVASDQSFSGSLSRSSESL